MHVYVIVEQNFKKMCTLKNLSAVTYTRKLAVSKIVDLFFSFLAWMHKDTTIRCFLFFLFFLEADGTNEIYSSNHCYL